MERALRPSEQFVPAVSCFFCGGGGSGTQHKEMGSDPELASQRNACSSVQFDPGAVV